MNYQFYGLQVGFQSTNMELNETIPTMVSNREDIGGYSYVNTKWTVWLFTKKKERDNCLIWMLRAAAQLGLPVSGII